MTMQKIELPFHKSKMTVSDLMTVADALESVIHFMDRYKDEPVAQDKNLNQLLDRFEIQRTKRSDVRKIECTFIPQVWIKDSAVEISVDEPHTWTVPMDEVTELTGVSDMNFMDNDPYARDQLCLAISTPDWIRNWPGPFDIEWKIIE